MTRIFISADMEGLCGVVSPLQCYPKEDLTGYNWAVAQMAWEINTIADGILGHDPEAEIVVNDAHNAMTNLRLDSLSHRAQLLSGKPKLCAMMAGLDSAFDGVIFVGYHAKAGAENGVLNHTFHSKLFDVQVNGVSYGEGGINALYASLVHRVPVILGSGDKAFCDEIHALIPNLKTIETKAGISTTAALSVSRDHLEKCYRDLVGKAVQAPALWKMNLLELTGPYTLRITFTTTLPCDVAMTSPLYTRVDGRTLEVTVDEFASLYRALQGAYSMLAYTAYME